MGQLDSWEVTKTGDEPYTLVEIAHIKRRRYNDIIKFVKEHNIRPTDYIRTQLTQEPKYLFRLDDFYVLTEDRTEWPQAKETE